MSSREKRFAPWDMRAGRLNRGESADARLAHLGGVLRLNRQRTDELIEAETGPARNSL